MEIKLAFVAVALACMFSRLARQMTFAVALAGIPIGAVLVATGHLSVPTGLSVAEIARAFHAQF